MLNNCAILTFEWSNSLSQITNFNNFEIYKVIMIFLFIKTPQSHILLFPHIRDSFFGKI